MTTPMQTATMMEAYQLSPQTKPAAAPQWHRWVMPAVCLLVFGSMASVGWRYQTDLLSLWETPPPKGGPPREEPVFVAGPGLIEVKHGSAVEHRLTLASAKLERIEDPLLNVSGFIVARLGSGTDQAESRWDFASPEIATAYGDWVKARADVAFAEKQAAKVKELIDSRGVYLKTVVARFEKLSKIGTETERDLASARNDQLQAEIQGQKDVFEAENAVKAAVRNRGLLERQLLQAGVDPEVVARGEEGLVLVVADVPEAKIDLVRAGQTCEARFYSNPGKVHQGRVGRLGPSVAKEKRTLRVTFELTDRTSRLVPGLFAEVGLGTETRDVLTIPADAVLHAGHSDYVLKEESSGKYRVVEVTVSESRGFANTSGAAPHIVVLRGLSDGDRVVSAGAILLKPVMVRALQ